MLVDHGVSQTSDIHKVKVLYCSCLGDWKHFFSQVKASDVNTHQGFLPSHSWMYV